jgi:DNA gyrase subunit A
MNTSEYINKERRDYALFILQNRAIPAFTDGLKSAGRRILWTARNGEKYKSATLAGATMPIHPHAAPETTVQNLAAPFGNNIPLLTGYGGFGTFLSPNDYSSARYTSVKLSNFSKDVVLVDLDLIPMVYNYDDTILIPKHFLPLIPLVLLNPSSGSAIGFASSILPRDLGDIINAQISYLTNKEYDEPPITMTPMKQTSIDKTLNRWEFVGDFEFTGQNTVKITALPLGIRDKNILNHLDKLVESGFVKKYVDNSTDTIDVDVYLVKGILEKFDKPALLEKLKLKNQIKENFNILDVSHTVVKKYNFKRLIADYCDWRVGWYKQRFLKQLKELDIEIQKQEDYLSVVDNKFLNNLTQIETKGKMKERLKEIGVKNVDYIINLPNHRFTLDEIEKIRNMYDESVNVKRPKLLELTENESERTKVYINELKEVLKNHRKDRYKTNEL